MSEQQPQTIQPQMPSIENEDNILQTLFGYFATFVRPYLWLYPTAVILFLAGGILFLRTATPIYSSTAEMMIASNEMRALDVKGIADPSYGMAGEAFIKTQIQVIQSSEVLSKVYERLGEEASGCTGPSIVRIPGTNLVNITVKSLNPEAAAKFANTVAEVYVDFMYKRKITISSTGANLLRDQLKEVQLNRAKAMEDLLKFKEEHGIYDLKQSYNALVNQRNELETKLFEAKMDCEEISTTLEEVNNNRANAVVMLPYLIPDSNSNLSTLQNLLLTHQMKLPELLTNYNKEHQAVKVHEEVKQMIQKASEDQVDVSLNGLKLKLQRVQRRCESLQAQINDKEQELIKLDKIGGDYRMREAACDKLDETITMITSRINELQIADATTIGNYNISKINDAKPNKKPVFPQPKKVLGLAFLGGLAFAALISFILVSINNKVTDISQITQAFNESVPVFGSLPLFSDPEGKLLQSNGEEPVDEVFRDIRTSLNLSMMTRNTKIIAVTSALPHEGKTFMTCNLARSFARDNKRILLLELDLRKPRLHRLLKDFLPEDVKKRQGVSNVLVGDCKLEDVVIHIDPLKIDVALAGPLPPNP
ncbi:MAG: hypothetical protein IKN52_16555, partial [Victivallales bacterium]|nr:hypothetical protein [Victivallales bacterium]